MPLVSQSNCEARFRAVNIRKTKIVPTLLAVYLEGLSSLTHVLPYLFSSVAFSHSRIFPLIEMSHLISFRVRSTGTLDNKEQNKGLLLPTATFTRDKSS